jgi:uncharacterized membrane protein YsdA (DUF1294 family)
MKILMYCLLALNVGVWLMYGIDKWKAKSKKFFCLRRLQAVRLEL